MCCQLATNLTASIIFRASFFSHESHKTCHSVTFYFMEKDSKRCCDTTTPESIHTKDESKRRFIAILTISMGDGGGQMDIFWAQQVILGHSWYAQKSLSCQNVAFCPKGYLNRIASVPIQVLPYAYDFWPVKKSGPFCILFLRRWTFLRVHCMSGACSLENREKYDRKLCIKRYYDLIIFHSKLWLTKYV